MTVAPSCLSTTTTVPICITSDVQRDTERTNEQSSHHAAVDSHRAGCCAGDWLRGVRGVNLDRAGFFTTLSGIWLLCGYFTAWFWRCLCCVLRVVGGRRGEQAQSVVRCA